ATATSPSITGCWIPPHCCVRSARPRRLSMPARG
ncbi:MAG: hypothetical protein AVDCRST_MAG87-1482, partial [uncultured Thermomicrobiales bacterium]